MGLESPSHWLIIALVVLVLFGYKKLPEMSRSVGRSLRIFKTEMKGMTEDDSARQAEPQPVTPTTAAPTVPPVQVVAGTPRSAGVGEAGRATRPGAEARHRNAIGRRLSSGRSG